MVSSTPDKVFELLKNSKSAGDVLRAVSQDPYLAIGLVAILAMIYLFGRIYIWPQINPFRIQWISDLWNWATAPSPPTPEERYPYAKVIYPTYR